MKYTVTWDSTKMHDMAKKLVAYWEELKRKADDKVKSIGPVLQDQKYLGEASQARHMQNEASQKLFEAKILCREAEEASSYQIWEFSSEDLPELYPWLKS